PANQESLPCGPGIPQSHFVPPSVSFCSRPDMKSVFACPKRASHFLSTFQEFRAEKRISSGEPLSHDLPRVWLRFSLSVRERAGVRVPFDIATDLLKIRCFPCTHHEDLYRPICPICPIGYSIARRRVK